MTLQEYIKILKKAGFQVLVPKKSKTFCIFSKDNKIGYCQIERGYAFSFSTVHKPNSKSGTGYRIHNDITIPTAKHAKDAFVLASHWANRKDVEIIVKYKSLDDYKNGLFGDLY